MFNVIRRADLHQIGHARNHPILRLIRVDGQVHFRVRHVLVVLERSSINRRLCKLQWQRNEVTGNHGLEQVADRPVQLLKARPQIVMIVTHQIARMNVFRECRQ